MLLYQPGPSGRAFQYSHDDILLYPIGIMLCFLTVSRKKTQNLRHVTKSLQERRQNRENGEKDSYSKKTRILLDIFFSET